MNKEQMVTITKQKYDWLLANEKMLDDLFGGLVRLYDDISLDRRKTFARQRKSARGKLRNMLAQAIAEWGPLAPHFLDGYRTAAFQHHRMRGYPHYVLTDKEELPLVKTLAVEGSMLDLRMEGTYEHGGGLVRFGMPPKKLVPWPKLGRLANIHSKLRVALEKVGRRNGSDPSHWLGIMRPLPVVDVKAIEVYDPEKHWMRITEKTEESCRHGQR